ncbi:MAG TPA: hypothetical protein PL070_07400 [Flavobacteriales bacterium]|nr:hypothetical protein [Flavobacteriales bacterium]
MFRLTLLSLALCFTSITISAQDEGPEVTMFSTYEDFAAKNGRNYQYFTAFQQVMGKVNLLLQHNGEKEKLKCADIWGFRYRDALFRIDHRYEHPVKLISYGNMCYYENGPAHLTMMRTGSSTADFSLGAYCYVSVDLKDELFQFSGLKKDAKNAREHFEQKDPMYRSYFDCVGHTNSVSTHRDCITQFEKDHPRED